MAPAVQRHDPREGFHKFSAHFGAISSRIGAPCCNDDAEAVPGVLDLLEHMRKKIQRGLGLGGDVNRVHKPWLWVISRC